MVGPKKGLSGANWTAPTASFKSKLIFNKNEAIAQFKDAIRAQPITHK